MTFEEWAEAHSVPRGHSVYIMCELAWKAGLATRENDWDDGYYHGTLDGANRCISKLEEYIKTVEEE